MMWRIPHSFSFRSSYLAVGIRNAEVISNQRAFNDMYYKQVGDVVCYYIFCVFLYRFLFFL